MYSVFEIVMFGFNIYIFVCDKCVIEKSQGYYIIFIDKNSILVWRRERFYLGIVWNNWRVGSIYLFFVIQIVDILIFYIFFIIKVICKVLGKKNKLYFKIFKYVDCILILKLEKGKIYILY